MLRGEVGLPRHLISLSFPVPLPADFYQRHSFRVLWDDRYVLYNSDDLYGTTAHMELTASNCNCYPRASLLAVWRHDYQSLNRL